MFRKYPWNYIVSNYDNTTISAAYSLWNYSMLGSINCKSKWNETRTNKEIKNCYFVLWIRLGNLICFLMWTKYSLQSIHDYPFVTHWQGRLTWGGCSVMQLASLITIFLFFCFYKSENRHNSNMEIILIGDFVQRFEMFNFFIFLWDFTIGKQRCEVTPRAFYM